MADRDALRVTVCDGWELTLAGIRRERSGAHDLGADVLLSNGRPMHADRVALALPDARAAFARAAASPAGPTPAAIERALLALLPDALALAQDGNEPRRSQADEVVALALDTGAQLFHTPDGDAYATLPAGEHHETWPLKARAFREWLARLHYEAHGKTPGAQALQDALGVLAGQARYAGASVAVHVRLAGAGDAIYLDLANDAWQAVAITADGWRIVADPPVRFRRTKGMLPLPTPEPGGTLDALRPFVNASDDQWLLVRAWLFQALSPSGPYPTLALNGEQGAAKSTTARMLRGLIDPSAVPLRRPPRDERDLMIAASNSWTVMLDNLSGLSDWLSDTLCVLATGGGMATRELYSDADETLFNAQRPALLTGIEDVVTRGDLIDRSLLVTLGAIPSDRRRSEKELWGAYERMRPQLLGAVLDHVARGLRDVGTLQPESLPRMADFALWATACELPERRAAFLSAYASNRASAHDIALEGSLLAAALFDFMETRATWTGTAGTLLPELGNHASDGARAAKAWPKHPRGLSGQLRRLAPHLRAKGIGLDFDRRQGAARARVITVEKVCKTPSRPSRPSAPDEKPYADAETDSREADGRRTVADGTRTVDASDRPQPSGAVSASTSQKRPDTDGRDGRDGVLQPHSHSEYCRVCARPLRNDAERRAGIHEYCTDPEPVAA